MRSRTLSRQHQQLKWLLGQAKQFNSEQLELQAHWARYLCVLAAGFIENALADVYSTYARSSSSPSISNYVEAALGRIQNPKASRFLETARAFNTDWEGALSDFLDKDGRREAIDSIMTNRHLIAHGKDSGISLVRVSEYLAKCVQVVEFIESQCNIARD
jgi:hypothetical protein